MATRKKPCTESISSAQRGFPPAYYQVHALLETVRAIQCYEDDLCTLLAEIQRSGKVGAGVRRDLLKLLHSMPMMSFHAELDSCLDVIEKATA